MKLFLLSLVLLTFLCGCASKEEKINPLGRSFGGMSDTDPLQLGANPTPPAKQEIPALIDGSDLVPTVATYPPPIRTRLVGLNSAQNGTKTLLSSADPSPRLKKDGSFNDELVFRTKGFTTDFLVLMGAGGGALTVWALAPGNWIWGYTLIDSKTFGDARVWQLIEFPGDYVMIKNAKTNTCLNAYKNGIVHYPCDASNHAQFWRFNPMANQAWQIQNLGNGKCIQAPIDNPVGDFHKVFSIFLTKCMPKGIQNLDQQWYIAPPPFRVKPPYSLRKELTQGDF